MPEYSKSIISLTQAFMNKVANKGDTTGSFKADVFNKKVNEYLWPNERGKMEDLSRQGLKALNKGKSTDEISEASAASYAEIYAAVAVRNGLMFQASRFIDVELTTEDTVKELEKAKLKKFAAIVKKARTDKGMAV